MQDQAAHPSRYRFNPADLLKASWWRQVALILYQSGRNLFQDDGPHWAAAIAYFALFSIFPLLLAGITLLSYLADRGWVIVQATRLLGEYVPQGQDEVVGIVFEAIEARGSIGIISILSLLWAGTRVFGVVTKALNIAYNADEYYGFFRRTLIEFAMLGTIGVMVLLALVSRPVLNLAVNFATRSFGQPEPLLQLLLEIVPIILGFLALYLIYRYVPRRRVGALAAISGAVIAVLLIFIARPIFSTYIRNFGNYSLIYGSITAIIVFTLWVWISALILLYGGEVASHVQLMVLEGIPPEEVEERHREQDPTHP